MLSHEVRLRKKVITKLAEPNFSQKVEDFPFYQLIQTASPLQLGSHLHLFKVSYSV